MSLMGMDVCPLCAGALKLEVGVRDLAREFAAQMRFVEARISSNPVREELKDLTDFMHGEPTPLLRCMKCGLVVRADGSSAYEEDPNDLDVMTQIYPRYVEAFRKKEPAYRQLLRPHAEVLELGSHLGGFLQTAEEWNWRPVGVDVGLDTTRFARSHGLSVRRGQLRDARFPAGKFESVFVWNCFEQLSDPLEILKDVRNVLRRHGLLVVRVPNVGFYRLVRCGGGLARKVLAYNNLLGFPYLHGYTLETLSRLMARVGFEGVQAFNSELITTPFADLPSRVAREEARISRIAAELSVGPWIEAVYRRVDILPRLVLPPLSPMFLPRAV